MRIGLIGDRDEAVPAHRAIPNALALGAAALGLQVETVWLPTETITDATDLEDLAGFWCVPASPYRSMAGALHAIHFARERGRPFLGTCGGFQHAILEYARNVLGWRDADHAETNPASVRPIIAPLTCALVEQREAIHLVAGSCIARAYGTLAIVEPYHCRFGVNTALADSLFAGSLRPTAHDAAGSVRAVEIAEHPFFVATLFQHERAAHEDRVPPLVPAFLQAAAAIDERS